MIEDAVNPEPGTPAYVYQKAGQTVAKLMNGEATIAEVNKVTRELNKVVREMAKENKRLQQEAKKV